ncbi:MAG: porin, partial [Azonexus sp.]|nr:porin [Azonexus sp.]
GKTASKSEGWTISGAIPFGKHTILASYSAYNDKSDFKGANGKNDRDGSLIGIAYIYKIYDNTALYANYGKQYNQRNASQSLGDASDLVGSLSRTGYDPSGFMMGLNTRF